MHVCTHWRTTKVGMGGEGGRLAPSARLPPTSRPLFSTPAWQTSLARCTRTHYVPYTDAAPGRGTVSKSDWQV